MAFEYLLSPPKSQTFRSLNLCKSFKKLRGNKEKYAKVLPFKEALEACSPEGPLIGFISKIIYVPNKNINEKQNHIHKSFGVQNISAGNFFAFTRIFSGKLKQGDVVYILVSHLEKEDHTEETVKVIEIKINKLFIWMGYHLDQVEEVGAGCICAIPEIGDYNVKYATIADSKECPLLSKIRFENNLLKVSIRSKELIHMSALSEGLKILKKVDPAIDMFYNEKGDMILEVSGEVHLEKCIKDLEDEFAKVEVEVSDPIVTFKETIISKNLKKKREGKKEVIKTIIKENIKAFQEDNKKSKERNGEEIQPTEEKLQDVEMQDEKEEVKEEQGKKVYRYNTESSSFFETSEEEDQNAIDEEWLYDDDRGTEKVDETDTRFIYKESNFMYQKKRIEEVKVNRKGVNMKIGAGGFLGLQRKKNHCEVETQNRRYKLHVRAIGMGQKAADFLTKNKNKIRKLFVKGANLNRKQDCVKFFKQFVAVLEEENPNDPTIIKLILRNLISFGPHRIGSNILLCSFAEKEDTLTFPVLSDIEEFNGLYKNAKKTGSYSKNRADYELYYAGISYEELLKSIEVGFEIALEKGPLCNEEMHGCIFIIEDLVNVKETEIKQKMLLEKLKTKDDKEKKTGKEEGHDLPGIKEGSDQGASKGNNLSETKVSLEKTVVVETMEEKDIEENGGDHDANMLEAIKNEGMSASKSRNSKSIITDDNIAIDPYGPMSTQLVSAMKKGCYDSFLGAEPRLVQGLLMCTILVNETYLGNVLESLSIRRSKIQESEYEELTNMFVVRAMMPIQESFGFFENIMKLTSGRVSPQLEFWGWDIIEMDPFYQPKTLEVVNIYSRRKKSTVTSSL